MWADQDPTCPRCGSNSDPQVRVDAQKEKMVASVQPLLDADVAYPVELSEQELAAFSQAVTVVVKNMAANAAKRPKMTTLLEEVAEAILASRGKHEHPLELELAQIAGVCGNLIWQMACGADIANLQTRKE